VKRKLNRIRQRGERERASPLSPRLAEAEDRLQIMGESCSRL